MRILNTVLLTVGLSFAWSAHAGAFEKKQMKDVDVAALTNETQRMSYTDGMHIAWWIPTEYWDASMSRDANVKDAARKKVIDILSRYSMVAVVQAEVGPLGNFKYYDRDSITKGMKIELSDGKTWTVISPLSDVPDELAPLLKVLGPILSSAMGALGQNLNFYVLDDKAKDGRRISPYEPGSLRITLTGKSGATLEPFLIEFPLDALYVPRRCPNGKPAHISWVVCPWDGSKLPQ